MNELWIANNEEGREIWAIKSSHKSSNYTVVVDDSVSWSKDGRGLTNLRRAKVVDGQKGEW